MINLRRRLLPFIFLTIGLFGLGTMGYVLIEGWSLVDAFYMTAISLTTVGFGEVRPLSSLGRIFTVLIILIGVGIVTFGFSTVIEYLLTAGVGAQLRRRRIMRTIDKLEGHIIVCGYGRVGQSAVQTLQDGQRPLVIVERDEEKVEELYETGYIVVDGDATRDETLREAGVDRAWGLLICTGDDSVNLFIVLSARALSPHLYIVTRSVLAENEPKMRRAGANRVVSPYQIGGRHMANISIRPHVTDFFDVVTLDGGVEVWVEELTVGPKSPLVGQTVGEADIRHRTGVTLVALMRDREQASFTPDAETELEPGDQLIVLGTREQLASLESLLGKEKI